MAEDPQTGPHELPLPLWSEVLSHLSLQDLLLARLVCRDFICLDHLKSLSLTWRIEDEDAASSLMLFVSRHCAPASSPQVSIKIQAFPTGALWSACLMASTCANLRSFHCLSLQMKLSVAQDCLQLLPQCIESLGLCVTAELVDEADWGRLTSLHSLHLVWPWVSTSHSYLGEGLAKLPALQHLTIMRPHTKGPEGKQLDKLLGVSAHTSMAQLRTLKIGFDLFHGRLELCRLTQLQEVHLACTDPLPKWFEEHPINHLVFCTSQQLAGIDIQKLQCRKLTVLHRQDDPPWQLTDLLKMPLLRELVVRPADLCTNPREPLLYLYGSQEEYLAFMRVKVKLLVPAKLRLQSSDEESDVIEMSTCGHACICMCGQCRNRGR